MYSAHFSTKAPNLRTQTNKTEEEKKIVINQQNIRKGNEQKVLNIERKATMQNKKDTHQMN